MQHGACYQSGFVDRVDCVAVGGAESHVQFPGLGAGGWTVPEVGNAVGAGKTDDETIAGGRRVTSCIPIGAKVRS